MEKEELSIGRLQYFPITLFAVVMGFSGLAISYQKGAEFFGIPAFIGDVLATVDISLFLVIFVFYVAKFLKYPGEVKEEFFHPIRVNFFAAISISMLLISIAFHQISAGIALPFFWAGVVLHTVLTFYTISFWINHNFEIVHSNPAWFIPIVGNVLIPVAGDGYAHFEFLSFYFSLGLLFWVVLFTVIFYRIIFHHQLAQKFIPTLFILIAPPSVGFIAYIKMGNGFDLFAHFLLNMGLFFTFLLFFMYKNFVKLKFFISWWAFTFPLGAITIATMLAYHLSDYYVYKVLSMLFLVVTTAVVSLVAARTIEHMLKKEVCVKE